MPNSKIILFLGAGFSMEAHQPIMSKFGDFSYAQLWGSDKNSYAGGFKGIGHPTHQKYLSYEILKSSGEIFEALRKKCKSNNKDSFDSNNMEDLFTYAEMREQCDYKRINLKLHDIEDRKFSTVNLSNQELVREIKIWLWQIFRRIPIHNPKKWLIDRVRIDDKFYLKFINYLADRGLSNFYLITTNYDLIIEYLCNYTGNKIFYPVNDYSLKEINSDTKGIYTTTKNSTNTLLYCKLHGSVNYYEKKNHPNKLYVNSFLGGKVGESKNVPNLPSASSLDSIYNLINDNLFPALIPPSYAKLEKQAWLMNIWNTALNSLIEANKWIFIGYSFPPSDGHMRSLINLALMERKIAPSIVLVSPDKNIIDNYKMLIDHNFKFYKKTFSEFIREDFKFEIDYN